MPIGQISPGRRGAWYVRDMTLSNEALRLRNLADAVERGAVVDYSATWHAGTPSTIVAHDSTGATVAIGPGDPIDPGKR